jgi:hypothetical protein
MVTLLDTVFTVWTLNGEYKNPVVNGFTVIEWYTGGRLDSTDTKSEVQGIGNEGLLLQINMESWLNMEFARWMKECCS